MTSDFYNLTWMLLDTQMLHTLVAMIFIAVLVGVFMREIKSVLYD